jgi:hypothetical protein
MCSRAVEFCLAGCEYNVTERDRVEGQRSKKKVGRFEPGKYDFNSSVNHPGGGTEQKCWRHEAQTNRSAGRGPDIARDASSETDTAHCEYLTTIYNSTKLCFVYFEFYRGKDPGKRNAWIILYAVLPVAASLQNRHFVMRNQTNHINKVLSFLVWEIHPVKSRSSVAVGSRKMVRYGRPAGMRAALSPKTGEKAVADQDDVGWPLGMLRE